MNSPVLEGRENPGIRRIKVKEGKRHCNHGDDPTHYPFRFDPFEKPFVVNNLFLNLFVLIRFFGFLIFSHWTDSPYLRSVRVENTTWISTGSYPRSRRKITIPRHDVPSLEDRGDLREIADATTTTEQGHIGPCPCLATALS